MSAIVRLLPSWMASYAAMVRATSLAGVPLFQWEPEALRLRR